MKAQLEGTASAANANESLRLGSQGRAQETDASRKDRPHYHKHKILRQTTECLSGGAALALATFVCLRFRLGFTTPICLYFLIVVLLSSRSSFLSSAIVSIAAVVCLDYFFLPPIFSFELSKPADYVAFIAFLATSLVITRLVARVRELMGEKLHRSATYLSEAQRLSHTGSFGWKVSTGEIAWSAETFRIFEFDAATKPAMELILQRVHPEDRNLVRQTIEQASQDGRDFDFQHRLLMPDGSVKYVHIVAHSEMDTSRELEFVGAVMDVTGIKGAEEKIRQIINTVPAQIWTAGPDGRFDFISERQLDYFGTGTLGQEREIYVHPDDIDRLRSKWKISVAEGKPFESEIRLRRFDGECRWFLSRALPLLDQSGQIQGWYGNDVDVHDRKQADALLASEKRLLEMVAMGNSLPVVLDVLCRLVEENASGCYCSVLLIDQSGTRVQHGAAPSLPASFNEAIHGRPVNADSGPCALAAYLNQQVIAADIASETRWEPYAWCPLALSHGLRACWATPILSTDRKVIGTFAIYFPEPKAPSLVHQNLIEQFTHIAGIAIERAQIDAALKRSETFLAETRRLSSTGGASKNLATGEIKWSEEVYRIFEFDPAETITIEKTLSRVHPEDIAGFHEMLGRQPDGGDYEHEYRLLMPDGSIKYVHVNAHLSQDKDGQPEYIAAIQDVTQRRLSEEALTKARSDLARVSRLTTLGELTASIAHEVNQPLSAVGMNANTSLRWLDSDPPNLDEAKAALRRILRDGSRGTEIIARIKGMVRKEPPSKARLNLNDVIQETIELARMDLYGAALHTELTSELPEVIADRVQLQQVLLNLAANAIDAMKPVTDRPRVLRIRTNCHEGSAVLVMVEDSGIGLNPQQKEQLFETFFTTKSDGLGMGLSICRSIIEEHGGRLWVESNSGPGATFQFTLPIASGGAV